MDKIIVENRTDLIDHHYFLGLDIPEIDGQSRSGRRTRVVNVYDNQVGQGHTWQGNTLNRRRAFEDITWNRMIRGRVLFLGDVNAHSPIWNPYSRGKKNGNPLEDLIEKFHLFINNES